VVEHVHFHVVPRFRELDARSRFGMGEGGRELMVGKGERRELDQVDGEEMAGRMRVVIERELRNARL
jgi:diadenosine tetraphosphate (Ap4A) HIT family hydrolase